MMCAVHVKCRKKAVFSDRCNVAARRPRQTVPRLFRSHTSSGRPSFQLYSNFAYAPFLSSSVSFLIRSALCFFPYPWWVLVLYVTICLLVLPVTIPYPPAIQFFLPSLCDLYDGLGRHNLIEGLFHDNVRFFFNFILFSGHFLWLKTTLCQQLQRMVQ